MNPNLVLITVIVLAVFANWKQIIGSYFPRLADRVDAAREQYFIKKVARACNAGNSKIASNIPGYVRRNMPQLLPRRRVKDVQMTLRELIRPPGAAEKARAARITLEVIRARTAR